MPTPELLPQCDTSPFLVAAMKNHYDYLEGVTDTELKEQWLGNTALLWSTANSCIQFALNLIDKDPRQVNIKSTFDSRGNTPLILAVSKGWHHKHQIHNQDLSQADLIKKLLRHSANPNEVDTKKRTALHYACLHRDFEAIQVLCQQGARWDIKDCDGMAPLDYCYKTYNDAAMHLKQATCGERNYVFTLKKDNFDKPEAFFSTLAESLGTEKDKLLKGINVNQAINDALSPIYQHLHMLLKRRNCTHTIETLEGALMSGFSLINKHYKLANNRHNRKFVALLKFVVDIKKASSVRLSTDDLTISDNTQKIKEIAKKAINNPILKTERHLISLTVKFVLNAIATLCLITPINYCITGNFFFSRKTKTGQLIADAEATLSQPLPCQ